MDMPEAGDTATIEHKGLKAEAEAVCNPQDGDMYWKTETGAMVSWRMAKVSGKAEKPKAKSKAKTKSKAKSKVAATKGMMDDAE